MSNKKKKIDPHAPVREINAAKPVEVKKQNYANKQADNGHKIVMWIIGALLGLGLVFLVWSAFFMV